MTKSTKRVSRFALPQKTRGSITIEAAFAVPFFFLAVLTLVFMLEAMAIKINVRSGLMNAGKQTCNDLAKGDFFSPSQIENGIVKSVGEERMNRSLIKGGSSGIKCEKSYVFGGTGICNLVVEYELKAPFPLFPIAGVYQKEEVKIKAWTGYLNSFDGGDSKEMVYITETGVVYHRNFQCTHLKLSIKMVPEPGINELRNMEGGKYHLCILCKGKGTGNSVYVTDYGDKYHYTIGCTGLKRTIYTVPLSEAVGKGACQRCSK
ncbi:hypothetical protein M2454_000947 [Aequitasia blattaphilus]|uniref:Pilus assembly protein n=1 Tax=Aequitasia blattaphilus TaxID=2949332 RepID=A0ABT1E9E7_9FIRM|nr:pilus assembly protein [Aequitasia blattaphilus]MCP1102445.1 pilus assembly protein [Aequitasia blattaphilus]MCR8615085.1 pilus assembly protein [Aequitasia blattaphilus]